MPESEVITLGRAVRIARENNKLSLAELGLMVGVTPQYLSKIENDRTVMRYETSKAILKKLETILKVEPDTFIELIPTKDQFEKKIKKYSAIGKIFVRKREELKLSRSDLSLKSGVSTNVIRDIEHGLSNSYHFIDSLCCAMDVKLPQELMPEHSLLVGLSEESREILDEIMKETGVSSYKELVGDAILLLLKNQETGQ